MTRSSDIDAAARPSLSGALLLRVVVVMSLVVGALLLVVGPPRGLGALASDACSGPTQAQAVMAEADGVRMSGSVSAPTVADVDGWAEESFPVDPASNVLPRLSASGSYPHGRAVARARDSAPPDRPPRHA